MTDELACPLTAPAARGRPAVGGKAAALAELAAAGLPVPAGFAVTTAAFGLALREIDPGGTIPDEIERLTPGDSDSISETTARVRERILAAPLPPEIAASVGSCYRQLAGSGQSGADPGGGGPAEAGGGPVPVAVRSSATAEDGAATSFAGLADTYLWVQGENSVADHVRRCWASLYSVESVSYRRHHGLPEAGLAMGVVVQAMVEPRCAGVMFTRSPVTGDSSVIVLEASWGLGSALVSGDVTPDSFVVSKVTGEILRRTVSSKLRCHQRGDAGTGVRVRDVPPGLRDKPCLADDEILALALLGRRVSEHYGSPQDIEWAITAPAGGGQRIALLQSRPETVWSRRAAAPAAAPKARPFDHVLDRMRSPGAGQ